jgi:GNAT superfamily N-acetyltransferase
MKINLLHENQHESMIDLLAEIHAFYNNGAVISREIIRDHLHNNLLSASSPHRLVVYSSDSGIVVGLAAIAIVYSLVDFVPEKRKHCQLKELYVQSNARARGVGRDLMKWVARYAVDYGCYRIDWPVKASNARGIAFYERLGATEVTDRLSFRLCEPAVSALAH